VSALVVFVHPLTESFGAAVLERVERGLASAGSPFEVIDLYADDYQPGNDLPERHQDLVARATTLALVYPTWWTTQPAILLGWLSAMVTTNSANSITSLVCVTTHGGSRFANLIAGRSGRHTAARVVRSRCAPGTTFRWVAVYGLDKRDESHRVTFLQRVEREFGRLQI
jgi:NAD(P)H dehydrogenase (quinone)